MMLYSIVSFLVFPFAPIKQTAALGLVAVFQNLWLAIQPQLVRGDHRQAQVLAETLEADVWATQTDGKLC